MAGEGREACAVLPGSGEQRAVSPVDRDDGKQERRRHIMRVMMALVLGLYLVLPARAADSGPVLLLPGASGPAAETIAGYRCADFLEEAGLKPEGLEYLFCRPAAEPRTGRRTLTARYRVPGPQAVAVERALRERTGMVALERQMGIWQLPEGGEGRFVLRQTAGADSTGVALPAPFLSVEGLRDGLSAVDTAGDKAGARPPAGIPFPVVRDDGRSIAEGSPAAVPGTSAGEGGGAALADSAPETGPSCAVSMGEVPQQGTFAPQREDWGKIAWFAVTVRLELDKK